MTKAELINGIMARTGFNRKTVSRFIDAFTETTTAALTAGEKVHISSFGSFETVRNKERAGVNPRTGERIDIKPSNRIKFTAGKTLKEAANKKPAAVSNSTNIE